MGKNKFLKSQELIKCQDGHLIFKESCKFCNLLQSEWYQYLENSGFEDQEKNGFLKITRSSLKYEQETQGAEIFWSRVNYYQWARSKLNDARFTSEKDKLIWEYHTEALSTREIAPRIGHDQSWVCRKINKIKTYLKAEIGSVSMAFA